MRRISATTIISLLFTWAATGCGSDDDSAPPAEQLDQALQAIVAQPDGPPGAVVVVQRGGDIDVHKAGVADLATRAPIDVHDHMRLGSVTKAFSGAAALAVVAEGALSLDDTIGQSRLGDKRLDLLLLKEVKQERARADFQKLAAFAPIALRRSVPCGSRRVIGFSTEVSCECSRIATRDIRNSSRQ